jgi:pyruvate/2-oxoglutarate dehydrogenase complex dihydrolipoamide dehydrogenase (E3) component
LAGANGFDLAILGGGSAAFAAVRRASELCARVVMVNEGRLGGTCVNVGCVPSKTLIRASENHHQHRVSRFRSIGTPCGRVDFAELIREKAELVATLRKARYADVLAALLGVRFVEGRARLESRHTVAVGDAVFRTEKIGVAIDVSRLPLAQVPRALVARDRRGFVKLLRARGEDRLVGARVLAPEGGEQIMEASLMIKFGPPVSAVARHFHPYLTKGEGMKLAALGFERDVVALSCCAQ